MKIILWILIFTQGCITTFEQPDSDSYGKKITPLKSKISQKILVYPEVFGANEEEEISSRWFQIIFTAMERLNISTAENIDLADSIVNFKKEQSDRLKLKVQLLPYDDTHPAMSFLNVFWGMASMLTLGIIPMYQRESAVVRIIRFEGEKETGIFESKVQISRWVSIVFLFDKYEKNCYIERDSIEDYYQKTCNAIERPLAYSLINWAAKVSK